MHKRLVVVVVVVRTVRSQRCLWRYHCMRAIDLGGRTSGSQTPGVLATHEPSTTNNCWPSRDTTGTRRPDGWSAKNAVKCCKKLIPPIIRRAREQDPNPPSSGKCAKSDRRLTHERVSRIDRRNESIFTMKMCEIRPKASGTGRNRPQDQDPRSTFTQECVKTTRPPWTDRNMYPLSNQKELNTEPFGSPRIIHIPVLLTQNQHQTSSCQVQGAVETHHATPNMYPLSNQAKRNTRINPEAVSQKNPRRNTSSNTQTPGTQTST